MRDEIKTRILALSVLTLLTGALAQSSGSELTERDLHYQAGTLRLLGGKASFDAGTRYRFLEAADAQKLLEEGWGNPPDPDILGMIVPATLSPLSREGWGVVVTYNPEGHISDKDASSINYTEMLGRIQEGIRDSNAEREKAGYGHLELIGWAAPPRYDSVHKKLYWAKELAFNHSSAHTLNYAVRILGRRGVLELNAVAGMTQLPMVQRDMEAILTATHFNPGETYADFNPSSDKMAEYGIAALVAGGVAAKVGLFAKIGLFLLGLKKFGIVLLLGIVALFRRLLGRRQV